MIQAQTHLNVHIGDVIVAMIKEAVPNTPLERSEVIRAVIVRTCKELKRDNGIIIRYDDNDAVVIDQEGNPKGTRIFGAIARELRQLNFTKIVSLAPEEGTNYRLAIAILFLIAGHMYRTNWGIGHGLKDILEAHKVPVWLIILSDQLLIIAMDAYLPNKCSSATVEQVGNVGVNQKSLGRAGSKCWLGKRPVVRGVVMNPVDHPHGGGEGRAPIGRKKPATPWGYPALGRRSRKRNKYSDNLILRHRSK
ncbi:hypothetical protein V6N12_034422 [Hibiscus sabdariffa]|uniref:Large ribosomal subunit protein uL2 C-terminal domain-containing protein n=1 Tax=Hibiscus sabdariffa TaxID=183260 RepID=A0ABR2DH56_9ROSI